MTKAMARTQRKCHRGYYKPLISANEVRNECRGLVKPLTPQHPYMTCDNLAQNTVPVSACMVAQARGFKPCLTCAYGGR